MEGGSKLRSWEEAKVFMKTFKKLTRSTVFHASLKDFMFHIKIANLKQSWSPELNDAYVELFDVDLDWVCNKEHLQPPIVPIYRPWVRLFEIGDVKVDSILKFTWETVE
jgi:2'-5' RNA ligase